MLQYKRCEKLIVLGQEQTNCRKLKRGARLAQARSSSNGPNREADGGVSVPSLECDTSTTSVECSLLSPARG